MENAEFNDKVKAFIKEKKFAELRQFLKDHPENKELSLNISIYSEQQLHSLAPILAKNDTLETAIYIFPLS